MVEKMGKQAPSLHAVAQWERDGEYLHGDPCPVTPREEQELAERRSESDALMVSAEARARKVGETIHAEWTLHAFTGEGAGALARSRCAALVIIARREAAKLAPADHVRDELVANGADAVLGELVLRVEALGRGDELARRRALAMVADAAEVLRTCLGSVGGVA
jgi:hypothetical protein